MGYTVFILLTMLVLPIVAILIRRSRTRAPLLELVGTWFIFFGVGVRLLVAGLMQILNPGFTGDLLQLDANVLLIIQELGFTNVLLAILALASLWKSEYRVLATAGAIYMGFAGILHLLNQTPDSTAREGVALYSDLWICLIALVYLAFSYTKLLQSRSALRN